MCGIVGVSGRRDVTAILMEGLGRLEYRGYDSCGIALVSGSEIVRVRALGRLCNLTARLRDERGFCGVGHTRWATHGMVSETNSHPHFSGSGRFAVVHNGIVENYLDIKRFLVSRGFEFVSETDSEVIAHLVEYYYHGDMLSALVKVCNRLEGSFALGIVSLFEPEKLYAARRHSPLVVGLGHEENYIASDMPALLDFTRRFLLLDDDEIAELSPTKVSVFNRNKEPVSKPVYLAEFEQNSHSKDGYPHYMLKEIYEQPAAIGRTLDTLRDRDIETILPRELLDNLAQIQIVACGSAFHAGYAGKYFMEKLCRIPVSAEVASEFIYREPLIDKNTLALIISQSGETADTLSGLRLAKKLGAFTLAIVNVEGSSIAREADACILTKAGTEIAVATTKGYTTQLATIFALAQALKKYKTQAVDEGEFDIFADGLCLDLSEFLGEVDEIKRIASIYHAKEHCFFIGRNMDFALSLEGALKLKEISYIHAECYPAGELKHGTISLIERGSLVIACANERNLVQKTLSNLKEVRSRGATCIVITPYKEDFEGEVDHTIKIPNGKLLSPLCTTITYQLLSYYIAAARNCDIDKPRNLAKSVTVE